MPGGVFRTGSLAGYLLVAGATLTGCSREAADAVESGDPFNSQARRTEDKFGEGFGNAFRADPMSEPTEVSDADVKPVSRTAEPVPIS